MPLIEIETEIHADIRVCFDLARSIDFHILSTSSTREKAIAGRKTGLIALNEFVTWQAQHFGFTLQLSSLITQFHLNTHFRDEQIKGPFKSMIHDHYFSEPKPGTIAMRDRFEFQVPYGWLGKIFAKLYLTNYMKTFLLERNRLIKHYAETVKWKSILKMENE